MSMGIALNVLGN